MVFLLFPLLPLQRASTANLIPIPQTILRSQSFLSLSTPTTISNSSQLRKISSILESEVLSSFGTTWKPIIGDNGTIRLQVDNSLEPEQYRLVIDKKITVTGGSYQAVAMGTATLLQSLVEQKGKLSVPVMTITDKPAFSYRGLMIDVARKYHSIDTLKQCIEMCRLYKVRYLQLHLTDDQAFTFPSTAFPKLTTVNQHGGPSYTKQELTDLVAYADDRAVTIVPEIDMPGHCAAIIRAMPELFKISGTKPYEHHATINFANDKVLSAIDTLVGEVCSVFHSSPYFHMGGDEADIANADQHPDFQKAFAEFGLPAHSQQEIFRHFIGQVNEMTCKRGKQLIVWEGFGRDDRSKFPIPKNVLVMEFESAYYQPNDLLNDGYDLINAAWTPLYVVNKHVWPAKKVYDWNPAKFGRFSNIYSSTGWVDVPNVNHIQGAQLCAWEQPEYLEVTNIRRILPAMSERIWNPYSNDYPNFANRLAGTDRLLGRLIEPIEIQHSELSKLGPDEFDIPTFSKDVTVSLKSRSPGEIRYTLDGSPPSSNSLVYEEAFKISATTTIRAGLFQGGRRGFESSMTFYYVPPKTPNLATGKKVTSSGGTQAPQNPELAVDDNLDLSSSWWAGPAPQWLQVDLGKESSVDRIELFPYWDGRRYYQYTIEVSSDNKTWVTIIDRSNNTVPATSQGDEHQFSARRMRYVRVNMLKGSANDSVHIVELKVWPTR